VGKSTSCYPSLVVERRGSGVVSHAGAVALLGTAQRTGLSGVLSEALARLSYSVGFFLSDAAAAALDLIPEAAWTPAYNADGQVRDGAWVAEATGVLDLSGWPQGMRVIVRKERPHPGAPSCG